MNSRAQKLPDEFQEGSYSTRRGKTRNLGKSYKPTHSRSAPSRNAPSQQPPPVEVRHHGDQNDLGIGPDFSMHLDPSLPTEEEVRASYGNVFNPTLKSSASSLIAE
jgi:hypothetical protein